MHSRTTESSTPKDLKSARIASACVIASQAQGFEAARSLPSRSPRLSGSMRFLRKSTRCVCQPRYFVIPRRPTRRTAARLLPFSRISRSNGARNGTRRHVPLQRNPFGPPQYCFENLQRLPHTSVSSSLGRKFRRNRSSNTHWNLKDRLTSGSSRLMLFLRGILNQSAR
jgi:hypothetical protein